MIGIVPDAPELDVDTNTGLFGGAGIAAHALTRYGDQLDLNSSTKLCKTDDLVDFHRNESGCPDFHDGSYAVTAASVPEPGGAGLTLAGVGVLAAMAATPSRFPRFNRSPGGDRAAGPAGALHALNDRFPLRCERQRSILASLGYHQGAGFMKGGVRDRGTVIIHGGLQAVHEAGWKQCVPDFGHGPTRRDGEPLEYLRANLRGLDGRAAAAAPRDRASITPRIAPRRRCDDIEPRDGGAHPESIHECKRGMRAC